MSRRTHWPEKARQTATAAGLWPSRRVVVEHGLEQAFVTTTSRRSCSTSNWSRRWSRPGRGSYRSAPDCTSIRTGLGDRDGLLGHLLKAAKLLWKSPDAGARPVVRLALAEEVAGRTGRYYNLEKQQALAPVAADAALAERLWAQALVGPGS